MKLKASELKLADVVTIFEGPFSTCIVKNIKDGQVHLFRPYGANADFSYTGGVICYIGLEQYSIPANDFLVEVHSRSDLR